MQDETSRTPEVLRADRKLGDEWEEWDGTVASDRSQAPAWVFLALAGAVVLLLALAGWASAWLVAPRLEGMGAGPVGRGLDRLWLAYLGLWYLSLTFGSCGYKTFGRLLRRLGGLSWSIGPAVILGRLAGISRDQVGHAFVLVHNRLEVLPPLVSEAACLLVLVPRCLDREVMQGLAALKAQYGFSQLIATGGTEARRAIAQLRPQGIIAVACERDLLSGVRDLKGRVPVLAFANQRPEGPCKNTRVDLSRIEDAIRSFLGGVRSA